MSFRPSMFNYKQSFKLFMKMAPPVNTKINSSSLKFLPTPSRLTSSRTLKLSDLALPQQNASKASICQQRPFATLNNCTMKPSINLNSLNTESSSSSLVALDGEVGDASQSGLLKTWSSDEEDSVSTCEPLRKKKRI